MVEARPVRPHSWRRILQPMMYSVFGMTVPARDCHQVTTLLLPFSLKTHRKQREVVKGLAMLMCRGIIEKTREITQLCCPPDDPS